jgi:hypothetical protein
LLDIQEVLSGATFEDRFIFVPEILECGDFPSELGANICIPFVAFLRLRDSRLEHHVELLAFSGQWLL